MTWLDLIKDLVKHNLITYYEDKYHIEMRTNWEVDSEK
jgi:hypothetical protein